MKTSRVPHYLLSVLWLVMLLLVSGGRSLASEAGKDYNEADKQLNVAYKAALATITDPQEKQLFVAAQKSWIQYRDDNVALFAARYPESKGGLFYMTQMTRQRTAYLKALLATPPSQDAGGPGKYQD